MVSMSETSSMYWHNEYNLLWLMAAHMLISIWKISDYVAVPCRCTDIWILHWGYRKKYRGLILYSYPSSCYTTHSSVLPHIRLHLSRHSLQMYGRSNNHVVNFTSNNPSGLVDKEWRVVGNTAVSRKGSSKHIIPTSFCDLIKENQN